MTGSAHPHLSDIERQILDYMVVYLRTNTYQPSIREIGQEFGIKSTKTVSEHLQALAEKGFLERDPSRSRGVRILGVDLSGTAVAVPCYDQLPAKGSETASEGRLTLDRQLAQSEGCFLMRAHGDELAALGVQDRDWVLIEPRTAAQVSPGETVALRTGDKLAYYRADRSQGTLELHSTRVGQDTEPVRDPRPSDVVGRVTAMIRRLDGASPSVSIVTH